MRLHSAYSVAPVVAGIGTQASSNGTTMPSQLTLGSPSEAQLSLSRQGSLRNHDAELRAQLAYGEAQEPNNSSALPNASGATHHACMRTTVQQKKPK